MINELDVIPDDSSFGSELNTNTDFLPTMSMNLSFLDNSQISQPDDHNMWSSTLLDMINLAEIDRGSNVPLNTELDGSIYYSDNGQPYSFDSPGSASDDIPPDFVTPDITKHTFVLDSELSEQGDKGGAHSGAHESREGSPNGTHGDEKRSEERQTEDKSPNGNHRDERKSEERQADHRETSEFMSLSTGDAYSERSLSSDVEFYTPLIQSLPIMSDLQSNGTGGVFWSTDETLWSRDSLPDTHLPTLTGNRDGSREGVESFFEGLVLGDFGDNHSWSSIAGQTAIGFVPVLGQMADARDLAAAVKDFIEDKDGSGFNLVIAVAAIVPGLDALKGGKKVAEMSDEALDASKRAINSAGEELKGLNHTTASSQGRTLIGKSTHQMRRDAERLIRDTPNHPLKFLLGEGGKFKSSKRSHDVLADRPDVVEMGHIISKKSGLEERVMLQGAWENQFNNITVEGRWKGATYIENDAIDIGGIAVDRKTAEFWESIGWLPSGTVESASQVK